VVITLGAINVRAGSEIPYISPDCNVIVKQSRESGFYKNKECDTIMVLPPAVSKILVTSVAPSANLNLCRTLKMRNDIIQMENQIIQRDTLAQITETNAAKLAALKKEIDRANADILKPYPLADQFGASLQVVFESGVDPKDVDQYNLDNLQLVRQGFRFIPVPISKGMLSFSHPVGLGGSTVLDVQVPGVAREGDAYTVLGIGTKSGLVTMSMAGACPMFDYPDSQANLMDLKVSESGVALAANYTYEVPIVVSRGYVASMDMKSFLNYAISESKRNGQFSFNDIYNAMASVVGNSVFNFKLTDYTGVPQGSDYEKTLRQDVFTRFADHYASELANAKVLQPVTSGAPNVNGGIVQTQVGIVTTCSSSSGFFSSSSSCSSAPWMVANWVDGLSSVTNNTQIKIDEPMSETVSSESLQYRAHTSALVFASEATQTNQ